MEAGTPIRTVSPPFRRTPRGREDPPLADTASRADLLTRLQSAAQQLGPLFRDPVLAAVPEIAVCALADLAESGLLPGDDMTASVAGALDGAVALLSFEPDDAQGLLAAAASAGASDPLARFTRLGTSIIETLAPAVLGTPIELVGPRLVEDSVAAALLQTHAPADTVLLSARLVVADEVRARGGVFYLLMDAKRGDALEAERVSAEPRD